MDIRQPLSYARLYLVCRQREIYQTGRNASDGDQLRIDKHAFTLDLSSPCTRKIASTSAKYYHKLYWLVSTTSHIRWLYSLICKTLSIMRYNEKTPHYSFTRIQNRITFRFLFCHAPYLLHTMLVNSAASSQKSVWFAAGTDLLEEVSQFQSGNPDRKYIWLKTISSFTAHLSDVTTWSCVPKRSTS